MTVLVNPYAFLNNFGGSGVSVGAHRFWRVRWLEAQDAGGVAAIGRVEMYGGVFGGANLCVVGSPVFSAQSVGAASNVIGNTALSDLDDIWADTTTGVPGAWIGWDFGAGNETEVQSILLQSRSAAGFVGQSPRDFAVEHSENGSSWTTAYIIEELSWTSIENKLFRLTSPTWSSYGPRRHWRLFFTKRVGNDLVGGSIFGIAEFNIKTTLGGSDQTGSGIASSSGDLSSTFSSDKAFDANSGTFWTRGAGINSGQWLAYDFGAGNEKDVLEFDVQVRPDAFREDPASFILQASSDGVVWETVWVPPLQTTWVAGELRTFTLS